MKKRDGSAGGNVREACRNAAILIGGIVVITALWAGAVGGVSATDSGLETRAGPGTVAFQTAANGTDSGTNESVPVCQRNSSSMVRVYNQQADRVPGFVRGRVKDSNIHMLVAGDNGGNYTLSTNEAGQVTEYSDGKPESASLRIEMDCETFRNITDSDSPEQSFRDAYSNDEIAFVGIGLVNWALVEAVKVATDPVSLVVVLAGVLLVVGYVVYRRASIHYRDF
jgi:hypothetical protein